MIALVKLKPLLYITEKQNLFTNFFLDKTMAKDKSVLINKMTEFQTELTKTKATK